MASHATTNSNGGITACFGKAGMAAGTTTTSTIANQVDYAILGAMYRKAAASNIAAVSTDATTGLAFLPVPASRGCLFVYSLNAAGTLGVTQGPISDGSAGYQWPAMIQTHCPIGYLKVVCASNGAFVWGTSSLASAPTGVTYTFADRAAMGVSPVM